ncbi:MAG TPA: hypothetical protein VLT36_16700 [Candidatus Dormibacteraeota bacterium]|nr:hypothetical protein [Candidatus Dormibacteraeota bacterium]
MPVFLQERFAGSWNAGERRTKEKAPEDWRFLPGGSNRNLFSTPVYNSISGDPFEMTSVRSLSRRPGEHRRPGLMTAGAVCILTLALTIGFILPSRKVTGPAIELLPVSYKISQQKLPIPDRWIPMKWGWMWRLKEIVVGKARQISLQITVLHLAAPSATQVPEQATTFEFSKPPDFVHENLRIWLLPNAQLAEVLKRLSRTNRTRLGQRAGIMTADGIQAVLSMGGTGSQQLILDVFPRVFRDSFELTSICQSLDSGSNTLAAAVVNTNLSVATRIRLPRDSGFFLLQSGQYPGEDEMALVIEASEPAQKVRKARTANTAKTSGKAQPE